MLISRLPPHLALTRPTTRLLRKTWYVSPLFRSQRELKRRWTVTRKAGFRAEHGRTEIRITLARIIGNDLFPRHRRGQALANLHTILEKEDHPYGWRKLFVLNRMLDDQLKEEALEAITRAGHTCTVIPFDKEAYHRLRYRPKAFGDLSYFSSSDFAGKDLFTRDRERLWACSEKIRYLMNINGARNTALALGRSTSDWTLVLDGSCILTNQAFSTLRHDMERCPSASYLIIPMRRLVGNDELMDANISPTTQEEPQIGFHAKTLEDFDEAYPYGLRDKTSLLDRLGVPGPWCSWPPLDCYQQTRKRSADRHFYTYASVSVLRLTSGVENGSLELHAARQKRYHSRITAILATLQATDNHCSAPDASALRRIAGWPERPPSACTA